MSKVINLNERITEKNKERAQEFAKINKVLDSIDTDAVTRAICGTQEDGNVDNTLLNKYDSEQLDRWSEAMVRSAQLRKET